MAMLFTAATVISVFYYATFARSIDVFVFGLIDEDTSAVLGTVWQGYPCCAPACCCRPCWRLHGG